jgi:hypothetical protein
MPIEVRELVIKATVSEGGSGGSTGSSDSQGGQTDPGEEMINMCVEKVLQILKEKNER